MTATADVKKIEVALAYGWLLRVHGYCQEPGSAAYPMLMCLIRSTGMLTLL